MMASDEVCYRIASCWLYSDRLDTDGFLYGSQMTK